MYTFECSYSNNLFSYLLTSYFSFSTLLVNVIQFNFNTMIGLSNCSNLPPILLVTCRCGPHTTPLTHSLNQKAKYVSLYKFWYCSNLSNTHPSIPESWHPKQQRIPGSVDSWERLLSLQVWDWWIQELHKPGNNPSFYYRSVIQTKLSTITFCDIAFFISSERSCWEASAGIICLSLS